ncbi:MAG: hypothetical protein HKO90_11765 [Flavobacteriaceae bacterium]|nr:hypothetical protein [Flavobacteriaceae bacterium]
MKTIMAYALSPLLILLVGIGLTACENQNKGNADNKAAEVYQKQEQDTMILKGYDLKLVKLDYPVMINESSYETAWIIKLNLSDMPTYYSERIDFFLGDYQIPEYGGWEGGIYFKVYDEELLRRLNNAEFHCRLPGSSEAVSLDSRFELPDLGSLEMIDENAVIGRKN